MNDSKIKVLLVEPEKYPKEIVIDDSLEAMQEVVGGDIEEYMPYDDDVAIICNAVSYTHLDVYKRQENILSVKQKHQRAFCLIRENTLFSLRKTKQLIPLRIRLVLDLSMKLCVEH